MVGYISTHISTFAFKYLEVRSVIPLGFVGFVLLCLISAWSDLTDLEFQYKLTKSLLVFAGNSQWKLDFQESN